MNTPEPEQVRPAPVRRAATLQVAKTAFYGLPAIGMQGIWEKDGAQVAAAQVVVAALIGGLVLVAVIIAIVRVVFQRATL
ncbi:MAG: hypothetical protein FJY55_13840 [Betaproteobacteria bacterium]|nr:hypothetical protein [Betaproteobacteria bacterium]